VKNDRPSQTALLVAGSHVAAALDPTLRQVLSDPDCPYWDWFVRAGAPLRQYLWKLGPTRSLVFKLSDAGMPGGALHLLVRKRFIEDQVRSALTDGIHQVVILGAGFDPLSLRLLREFPQARFVEIDHPATQGAKRRVLADRGANPAGLTLAPNDFSERTLADCLRAIGTFRDDQRSLFLAEGVLMYLRPEAVAELFNTMRGAAPRGSRCVFTALDEAAMKDPESGAARTAAHCARLGEPVLSSQNRRTLDDFLRRHGFRRRELADHRTLKSRYLDPIALDRPLLEGEFVVAAERV
jgi:methyltransferase (TIGR00027 family)